MWNQINRLVACAFYCGSVVGSNISQFSVVRVTVTSVFFWQQWCVFKCIFKKSNQHSPPASFSLQGGQRSSLRRRLWSRQRLWGGLSGTVPSCLVILPTDLPTVFTFPPSGWRRRLSSPFKCPFNWFSTLLRHRGLELRETVSVTSPRYLQLLVSGHLCPMNWQESKPESTHWT